jgi:putative flippase GtrA
MTHGPAKQTSLYNQYKLPQPKLRGFPLQLTAGMTESSFGFELNKLIRFVIVGGATFVFQFCIYWICSRILMPDIARLPVYMLSLAYAIAGNYTAHRLWTFRDQKPAQGSVWRYACVAFSAVLLNAIIFHLGVNLLHINDLIIVLIAESLIPLITYAGHRFYTFR